MQRPCKFVPLIVTVSLLLSLGVPSTTRAWWWPESGTDRTAASSQRSWVASCPSGARQADGTCTNSDVITKKDHSRGSNDPADDWRAAREALNKQQKFINTLMGHVLRVGAATIVPLLRLPNIQHADQFLPYALGSMYVSSFIPPLLMRFRSMAMNQTWSDELPLFGHAPESSLLTFGTARHWVTRPLVLLATTGAWVAASQWQRHHRRQEARWEQQTGYGRINLPQHLMWNIYETVRGIVQGYASQNPDSGEAGARSANLLITPVTVGGQGNHYQHLDNLLLLRKQIMAQVSFQWAFDPLLDPFAWGLAGYATADLVIWTVPQLPQIFHAVVVPFLTDYIFPVLTSL